MLVGATKPFARSSSRYAVTLVITQNSAGHTQNATLRDRCAAMRMLQCTAAGESLRNLIHNFRNLSYFVAICGECATDRAISCLRNGHFVAPINISC
jgi:hypothetical protein